MTYVQQVQQFAKAGRLPWIQGACKRCAGWGYTQAEAPELQHNRTIALGSGCARCRGTGKEP